MAEWQWLMMPVKCLGKECKNCPQIEIRTDSLELFANNGSIGYEVNLSCMNLGRCLKIKQRLEEGDQD